MKTAKIALRKLNPCLRYKHGKTGVLSIGTQIVLKWLTVPQPQLGVDSTFQEIALLLQ